jgi:hypothetical protein
VSVHFRIRHGRSLFNDSPRLVLLNRVGSGLMSAVAPNSADGCRSRPDTETGPSSDGTIQERTISDRSLPRVRCIKKHPKALHLHDAPASIDGAS